VGHHDAGELASLGYFLLYGCPLLVPLPLTVRAPDNFLMECPSGISAPPVFRVVPRGKKLKQNKAGPLS
jgi:hypothetical protein